MKHIPNITNYNAQAIRQCRPDHEDGATYSKSTKNSCAAVQLENACGKIAKNNHVFATPEEIQRLYQLIKKHR